MGAYAVSPLRAPGRKVQRTERGTRVHTHREREAQHTQRSTAHTERDNTHTHRERHSTRTERETIHTQRHNNTHREKEGETPHRERHTMTHTAPCNTVGFPNWALCTNSAITGR